VSLLLFFFLSTWPHFDDDGNDKEKLKIETSIISVYLHSCNPIVASEKTPKRLKTQSSLFSPFPEHEQSQRDVIDRVERQVENIIFPFQNTCSPPLLLKDKRKLGFGSPSFPPIVFLPRHCLNLLDSQRICFSKPQTPTHTS
jgi:hypothetical protein